MNCLGFRGKKENLEETVIHEPPMLFPCNHFYLMGKLWFSKVKKVNLIKDLPGAGSVL